MDKSRGISTWRVRVGVLVAAMATVAVQVAGITPANAFANTPGIPSFPDTVVGQTFPASLALTNNSTPPESTTFPSMNLTDIDLYPACTNTNTDCAAGTAEAGVYGLSATGTGVSTPAGNATCNGTWTLTSNSGVPATTTKYRFTPPGGNGTLVLAVGEFCTITFTGTTLRVPTNDVSPGMPGVQTNHVTGVTAVQPGSRTGGTDTSTVGAATPVLTTSATTGAGTPGMSLATTTDTATLSPPPAPSSNAGAAPTGSITFNLYGPNNATCMGGTAFTATVPVNGFTNYSSGAAPLLAPGTYRWVATYSGDANYSPVANACNDPAETITVASVQPTISTVATSTAIAGGPISDTATLAAGFNPTGTITFTLFGPGNPTCAGAAIFTSTVAVNAGNGSYPSAPFTTSAIGTYNWVAAYSGDANNNPATSPCGANNESTAVSKASPTITTNASPGVNVGGQVSDTATVAGGAAPTGTITFDLYGPNNATCTGQSIFNTVVNVNGNGAYPSAPLFTVTQAGIYRWVASYSGDANNNPVGPTACSDPNEDVAVKAAPTLTTNASPGVAGSPMHDTGTLSGGANPTGSITFNLYNDAACTAQVFTSTITVNGNGGYQSGDFTPFAAGAFHWIATYSGDAQNNAANASLCQDPAETVNVIKASPTIVTASSTTVTVGGVIRDTATIAGGSAPGGTVTFTLFGPNDATCSGAPAFTTAKPVAGNGSYLSADFTTTAAGTYRWIAAYSGDPTNNAATTACNDPNESVVVTRATPILTTTASPSVIVGNNISDTAHLTAGFGVLTGTITFNLYQGAGTTCTGATVFTSTVPVNGTGDYPSPPFTTTAADEYHWVASYSGDANNNAVGPTACNDPNEIVQVLKATPVVTTTASPSVVVGNNVSDTASLTGGFNPSGTVTFNLYGPTDPTCAGGPLVTSTIPLTGGSAASGPFPTALAGTYHWAGIYSGDANNNTVSTACGDPAETVVVTKASPTVATTASGSVPAGGPVSDQATLASGFNPTGTITFNLYGPADVLCVALPAFTSTVPVNANGIYSSGVFNTTAGGSYQWRATYSGDVNNNPFTSACDDVQESVVVTPQVMTGRAYGASIALLSPIVNPSPDTGPVATTTAGTVAPPCVTNLPGILDATVLCADVTTTLGPPQSKATATVAGANILTGISGVPAISVTGVKAESTTTCAASTGKTTIANLTIGGLPVDVSNLAPNTNLNLGVATLILNEQLPVPGADRGLTVNALHLIVPGLADIVLASATSDIHNCYPPVQRVAPLPVSVGYADRVRPNPFTPTPWVGSPNTNWVGLDPGILLVDSGAVRVDNPTAAPIFGVRVTVDVGPNHYDLWGVNTIPAHGQLVLFQTIPLTSFDTSDGDGAPCNAPSATVPVVHVAANGVTRDYRDYRQVLNTGGIDRGECFNVNEGTPWTPATVVPISAADNVPADFDGDLHTDISVYRPTTGQWFVRHSADGDTSVNFGVPGDIPANADFDGDGVADVAVFRPSVGEWLIRPSTGGPDLTDFFGLPGDLPVPGDFNGDGKDDLAVFRPSVGAWYIRPSGGGPDTVTFFGLTGDIPVVGDYDGDGRADVAVFRPSQGAWYVRPSLGGPDTVTFFGLTGDIPTPGDYDSDGKTDQAVFRPSQGAWYVHPSTGPPDTVTFFGLSGDIPAPGVYDADGKTDVAVFRPSTGQWFIQNSSGGTTAASFGMAGDDPLPLPSAIRGTFFP